MLSLSLGMGSGLVLPQPIPREAIRRYGRALRFSGEELADFMANEYYIVPTNRGSRPSSASRRMQRFALPGA